MMHRVEKKRRVRRLPQWLTLHQAAQHGLVPTRGVVHVDVELFGGERAAIVGNGGRERGAEMYVALLGEVAELRGAQHHAILA